MLPISFTLPQIPRGSPQRPSGSFVLLPSHVFKCHSLRASTATNLLEQGVELSDVQYLLGHSDPRTTKLYDRRRQSVTRNIVERIAI